MSHPTWIEVYELLPPVVHPKWCSAAFWARVARRIAYLEAEAAKRKV